MLDSDTTPSLRGVDLAAFEQLYRTYYDVLCKLAATITHSHQLAEEIVDDLFFYLWHHRSELEVDSLQAYLFRAVRNNSEKVCRSRAFRHGRLTLSLDNELLRVHDNLSDAEHPLGWLIEEEMQNHAQEVVNQLSHECRQVFELSRYHGKKHAEIAQELGISVNTVKYHIKNALKILSSSLSTGTACTLMLMAQSW
ncbi:RNA polymerase sigma-70 factor [Hoylesella shahii]|uniref:RNA polymerase sigma-70 factor n=1 Tax=Hoylesella shahii TaxID=228603 RepID=UPI0028F14220|nr:RNA polymerase sigma-70 factor [Hoylesella shahii]